VATYRITLGVSFRRSSVTRKTSVHRRGDREANSHGRGIKKECFINNMFCLHGSKLFIGFCMTKIFYLPNIWKTCACRTCILLSILIKIKRGEKEKKGKCGHSSRHNMARKIRKPALRYGIWIHFEYFG
jgi:hypothetical protein